MLNQPPNIPEGDDTSKDDFPLLSERFQQFIEANDKLIDIGTPSQMLSTGFVWRFARIIILLSFIPLLLVIISILSQNFHWNFYKTNLLNSLNDQYPYLIKPIGVFIAILFVSLFGFFTWKPFYMIGVWGGKQNSEKSYTEIEKEKEYLFFNSSLKSESGYNSIFIYSLLISIVFIGFILALIHILLGLITFTIVAICAYLWFTFQRNSRPEIKITQNGDIQLTFNMGKTILFNVKDCDTVEMEYFDSLNYTNWQRRLVSLKIYKALGVSTLFPKIIKFTNTCNSAEIFIDFENLRSTNGVYFNTWETEFYFAHLLNVNDFKIFCKKSKVYNLSFSIESWLAIRK